MLRPFGYHHAPTVNCEPLNCEPVKLRYSEQSELLLEIVAVAIRQEAIVLETAYDNTGGNIRLPGKGLEFRPAEGRHVEQLPVLYWRDQFVGGKTVGLLFFLILHPFHVNKDLLFPVQQNVPRFMKKGKP